MAFINHRRLLCLKWREACGAFLILAASVIPTVAGNKTSGGVRIKNSVSVSDREELVRRVQTITGWHDLDFDQAGSLTLNPSNFQGGSASARELLKSALAGGNLIVLEGVNSRSDVVFCRVDLAHWLQNDGTQPTTYVVLIDFNDFKTCLRRQRSARSI